MPAILRMRSTAALPFLLVAVLLASMFAFTPSASAMTRSQRVGISFDVVRNQIGDPYRYGAAGPNAFDCSGLVYYSFHRAGFTSVPRTASSQASYVHRITRSNMRRGDLVFFYRGYATARDVYHVGVFAGWSNGHRVIIHAPHSGTVVHRERLWTNSWFPGTLR
jgi:cell wall-associated NlpC family hydrolase